MRYLDVSENGRILFVRAPAAAPAGPMTADLALELVELCTDLEQRLDPLCGVIFESPGDEFYIRAPTRAQDCDAVDETWSAATRAVARLQQPTIAALAGDAIGPAWELALACDLRLAQSGIQIGSPEIRWGRMPRSGGTQRLAQVAGIPGALELLLLGQILSAEDAYKRGLVHRVGLLDTILQEIVMTLGTSAPIALNFAKEAVHAATELSLPSGLRLEADLAALLLTTADRAEGIGAYLARRNARFEGR